MLVPDLEPAKNKAPSAVHRAASAYAAARVFSSAERERLIESHLPQVRFIADRLAAKLPASVDRDDLIGAGVLGLLDAVDRYDPARGVMFKTFAELRVRGAMLDSLRDLDWAPRSARRRAREVEAAYRDLEIELKRPATEEEVARRLEMSLAEFHSLLHELRSLDIGTLDSDADEDAAPPLARLADAAERTPLALYEQTEERERLQRAIDRLPERERRIIALYFVEELTMKEIGAVLGITESRVSQLRTGAILRLRAAFGSNAK